MWRCSSAAAPTASVALTDAVRIIFLAISKTSLAWARICVKMLVFAGQGSVGYLLRCGLGEASAVSDPKGRVYYWGEHRPRSHGARVQERNIAEWNWSRLDAGGLSSDHALSRTMCTMRCVHSLAWRYCLGVAGSWIWFSGRVTRPAS